MRPLIKVVEIWVPDAEGQLLVLGDGFYGDAAAFGVLSRTMCFGRGEGLPGYVWEARSPVILKDLQDGRFRRAASAKKAGLACAIAVPLFAGDLLKAVVMMFCGDDAAGAGAIELWRTVSDASAEMALVDGYYGSAPPSAESVPRKAQLRLSWHGQATLLPDAPSIPAGLTEESAVAMMSGQGGWMLPCGTPTHDKFALVIFAEASAVRIGSWMPDASGGLRQRLLCVPGQAAHSPAALNSKVDAGQDAVVQAFDSGVPVLASPVLDGPHAPGHPKGCQGRMLALPVFGEEGVTEVLALYI